MVVTLLLLSPVEEFERKGGIGLNLEHLGDEARRHPAELAEFGNHRRPPLVTVFAERVEDEAGDRREAEGGGE